MPRGVLLIRGHKVPPDADLAGLYGVTTKPLNEQVKRNPERFPEDFPFSLTAEEKGQVVANCDHLQRLKFPHRCPAPLPGMAPSWSPRCSIRNGRYSQKALEEIATEQRGLVRE